MPRISVIMPVYNVEQFVGATIESVLAQTFDDFELLIVDDRGPDGSMAVCARYDDPRIRFLRNPQNRGLAGARNTGIRNARGELLAFLDSDDLWEPRKLALHVAHLDARPAVGVSFSRSAFIHADGSPAGCYQMPRLRDIEPGYYLCRNPIGNGSAPVIRRAVLDEIAFEASLHGAPEPCYFDETFRQSEDIECWIRIALTCDWRIEGIPEALTRYRLNAGGLSAQLHRQFASWEQMIAKTRTYAPGFVADWEQRARAFQLRYLARQAIRLGDGPAALQFMVRALREAPGIAVQEPGRTLATGAAAVLLRLLPPRWYRGLEAIAARWIGALQLRRIRRDAAGHAPGLHSAKPACALSRNANAAVPFSS